jgi:hypothetical protein
MQDHKSLFLNFYSSNNREKLYTDKRALWDNLYISHGVLYLSMIEERAFYIQRFVKHTNDTAVKMHNVEL